VEAQRGKVTNSLLGRAKVYNRAAQSAQQPMPKLALSFLVGARIRPPLTTLVVPVREQQQLIEQVKNVRSWLMDRTSNQRVSAAAAAAAAACKEERVNVAYVVPNHSASFSAQIVHHVHDTERVVRVKASSRLIQEDQTCNIDQPT